MKRKGFMVLWITFELWDNMICKFYSCIFLSLLTLYMNKYVTFV